MYLVYKPEGQPEQRWHFQPGRMNRFDMLAIEKVTGLKYGQQFKQELMQGGTEARAALLWVHLRREHPTIDFRNIEFFDDELQLLQDKDETLAEIAALEGEEIEGLSELERAAGLALLRRQLAEAPDAPGKAPTATTAELQHGGVLSPGSGLLATIADTPPPLWIPDPTPPQRIAAIPDPAPGPGGVALAPEPQVAPAASTT